MVWLKSANSCETTSTVKVNPRKVTISFDLPIWRQKLKSDPNPTLDCKELSYLLVILKPPIWKLDNPKTKGWNCLCFFGNYKFRKVVAHVVYFVGVFVCSF